MDLKNKIKELSRSYHNDVVEIRRHLHQHPELSFAEHETSAYIKSRLQEIGIPFRDGYVKTGIVASIKGQIPGTKIIALRADMDALPIIEENTIPYKSANIGKMHACGHDVHTASLLGCARILFELREHFSGTVSLVFQPGEEKLPGGAKLMLDEGVFSDGTPEVVIGQHVQPGLEAGKAGFKKGMFMASADEIYITVHGKGGHAGIPHENIDPVVIAAHIITSLQQVVSRYAKPAIPTVLSFGKVTADGATNIIPSEVKLEGTFRTFNEDWRTKAHKIITGICSKVAEGMGGSCDVEIRKGYPFLVNDDEVTSKAMEFASTYLGESNVEQLDLRMTAEDFAYFSQKFPATFYRLGVMDKKGNINSPLHTSTFNIDETALETGMGLMAWLAISFLR